MTRLTSQSLSLFYFFFYRSPNAAKSRQLLTVVQKQSTTMSEATLFFGPLAVSLLIGASTILLLYWFSTRNHDYWKKKGVPYVKPLPLIGSMKDNLKRPMHEIEMERYNKFGSIYGAYEASTAVINVGDPFHLREILVKSFGSFTGRRAFISGDKVMDKIMFSVRGEDWKRIRSIVSPTFSTGKIRRMQSIFRDCSRVLMDNFKTLSEDGKPINVKRLFGAFSMDVIASTAFSTKIDSLNDPENDFVKNAKKIFNQQINLFKVILFFAAPNLVRLLRIKVFDQSSGKFFSDITLQIIKERKRTGQTRNDFLQLLLDTAKEVAEEEKWDVADSDKGDIASNYSEHEAGHQIFKTITSKNLSMNELVAQCVLFFIAGYETTANTLSFATYFLAVHQDIQDKLRDEVDEALSQNNGEMTYEAVQSMKYLDNVISETLRICPVFIKLERQADADYEMTDQGITIPKGMLVYVPVYAMHNDPKFFPDPEKFDPDRFTAEERAKRDPYVYLPFGAGPRNCVGMRFALMEIKVCLSYIIASFRLNRCSETKVPLEFGKSQQGLLQPTDIVIQMEVRNDSPLTK